MVVECDVCHQQYEIGEWPFCPHGKYQPRPGFEPYFDIGLGEYVTGWGDIRKHMREKKLDFRDHPSPAAQRERADRMREKARAERGRR